MNRNFDNLPAAQYWAALRADFGGLRVNFGHFGGFEETTAEDWSMDSTPVPSSVNARDLVTLMSADSSAPGGRFFADSAYDQKILNDRAGLEKIYAAALSWKSDGQSRPVLQDRMMYGSDWSVLMLEKDMQEYFADFVGMYSHLDQLALNLGGSRETLSDRFFGENAVEYLGLREGLTRRRLIDFYTARGMTFNNQRQPTWMRKIKT
jgi:hypothetical protein